MGTYDFTGKKALIVGAANERSLAWYIAQELHQGGCEICFTFIGDAIEKRVRPLAASIGSQFVESLDVREDSQIDDLFAKIKAKWGKLDFLIHSVAFANKHDLEGRFIDTSREGFKMALDISAYSLVALSKASEPLMEAAGGGSIVTLSYYGAEKVIKDYNVMGVAKAALEASVRYLANDVGQKKIRVNAISAGPVRTLAAAGIRNFRNKLNASESHSPMRENISGEDVGAFAAFLCSPGAKHITGTTLYVDSGLHTIASQV